MLALRGQRGPAAAAALLHGLKLPGVICEAPQHGPCHGYIDSSFTIGQWTGSTEEYAPASKADLSHTQVATFQIQSHQRLAALERRHLFHHRSAICLYPHDGYPQGWLAGYAEFHMDGPDVQAFVGFVCFFGIALPLICMVTVLLHVNKQQRCKQHVQALRMQLQREQLERELHDREEVASAWAGVGTSTSTSTSSTTRSSPWRPHRLPPPRVQRPTMDDGHLPIL